jgi:hypothetical protein
MRPWRTVLFDLAVLIINIIADFVGKIKCMLVFSQKKKKPRGVAPWVYRHLKGFFEIATTQSAIFPGGESAFFALIPQRNPLWNGVTSAFRSFFSRCLFGGCSGRCAWALHDDELIHQYWLVNI